MHGIVHQNTHLFSFNSCERYSLLSVIILGLFRFCPISELGVENRILPHHSFSAYSSLSGLCIYWFYTAMKGAYCLSQAPRLNSYLVPKPARKLHCFQINSNTMLVEDLNLLWEWCHPKIKNKKIKKILHLYIAKTGKSSFLT